MTSSGDGIVPRANSNETLKVLYCYTYCYTQGIAALLIAFMQRLHQYSCITAISGSTVTDRKL